MLSTRIVYSLIKTWALKILLFEPHSIPLRLQFLQVLLISSFTFAISKSIASHRCRLKIKIKKKKWITDFLSKKRKKIKNVYWPITVKMTTSRKWISFLIKHQLLEPEIVSASVLKCFYCWSIIIFWALGCWNRKINWDYNFWELSFSRAFSSEAFFSNS